MKRIVSLLTALALVLSMAPATMAEGAAQTIAAPYAIDEGQTGPTEYLAPVFYENENGPTIGVTLVGVLQVDGLYFKDSDNDQELDAFEDWRLDTATRVADLVSKMSVEQKIGLLGIELVCSPAATTLEEATDENGNVLLSQLMTVSEQVLGMAGDDERRVNNSTAEIINFGSRAGVVRVGTDAAAGSLWKNALNMTAEYAAVVKGEPNVPYSVVSNPQITIGEPGTMGIAAAVMGDVAGGGDYGVVEQYGDVYRQIWDAKGIDRMYGPQIDLITDPRWSRNVTTFTEVPEVNAGIASALVKGYQGGTDGVKEDGVALIVKHFPGDGAANNGLESHYLTGQWRMYLTEGSLEKYQLAGFQAAFDAKAAGVMPCYSRPSAISAKQTYRGVEIEHEQLASAYNPVVLQTLLREAMGFEGFVNTDSNVLLYMPWGAEGMSEVERAGALVNAGCDIVGEYWGTPYDYELFLDAYNQGYMTQEALDRAAANNVTAMMDMGRFENPYEDVEANVAAMDELSATAVALGAELSRKSVVLLKNHESTLPLGETGKKVFIASLTGRGEDEATREDWNKAFTAAGYTVVTTPEEADIALIDIAPTLNEYGNAVNTLDLVDGLDVPEYDAYTGEKTGDEVELVTLMDVKKIAKYADAVHENGGVVIGSININAPWILQNFEPYCDALIGRFGTNTLPAFFEDDAGDAVGSVQAQMDVLTGAYNPTGKLPITMVSCNEVIATVATEIDGVEYDLCVSPNDVPGYDKDQYMDAEVLSQSPSGSYAYQDADGNLYRAWFGLSY